MDAYKKYLIEEIKMREADADILLSGSEKRYYKKGADIQKQGDASNIVRIIIKGCARGFMLVDGKEVTTNFYFEKDHAYDYVNYLKEEKVEINIQALDDVEAIEISMEALDFLNSEILGIHQMNHQIFKMYLIILESQRIDFIVKTPKQRYLTLLKNNKEVISRVPQHQIASFIGISAEHLSRIRKEIRDNE
ncbi:Crp/Fnr family transcriptional regulator [Saccharicrinis aurantiacus]|uniref:Crp/Fnr family transcriptional regulator n=1 Tax=Saccharicrinis aurantiacus TaxID=1849719 RepID=UPI002490E566|nr:cyclic nucleotide-binding domain-containing protein [Saccharicrinis aurantiacus]